MKSVQQLIQQFNLLPHPEGGWYSETYRSKDVIPKESLPAGFSGDRVLSTAIFFLLEQGHYSAFHRIKSDECWHFYAGGPLEIFILQQDGTLNIVLLGNDVDAGQRFQYVVPAHCWFASRPATGSRFCFVGCTVSPGFDFDDFELAHRQDLAKEYPGYETMIEELCRQ
ncbi:MAG TPA: cupin domain-containing protein [Ferruginibacter sp.]|nr:cupin domain-containing protein [Ferruginibacter sp.]